MIDLADLVREWHALVVRHTDSARAADVDTAGRTLLACWAQPHRRYHDLAHLGGVLSAIDELGFLAADADAVRLAAWYHDAVYEGSSDDEELSARMATDELAALGLAADLVAEVARLIRMTVEHNPAPADSNGAVLSDADLAVLAVPRAEYQRNSANVRAEYGHVSDEDFRVGRARVIAKLLAAPALYRTDVARELWESAARANLSAELASLS